MHFLNRHAVPWGAFTGVVGGVLHHFMPRSIDASEFIALAATPLLFPAFAYTALRVHRDMLESDLDYSHFDQNVNPLSFTPVRPINMLGVFAKLLAGCMIGFAIVSFLNWPFNLLYAILYGLGSASVALTVIGLPALLKTPATSNSTAPSKDPSGGVGRAEVDNFSSPTR